MSMMKEFKEFAMKGNVMDLAVGVIIGGAFGKIVDSVVGDLIMPLIAWIMGGKLDFSGMFLVLGNVPPGTAMTLDALKKAQVPVFAYGPGAELFGGIQENTDIAKKIMQLLKF